MLQIVGTVRPVRAPASSFEPLSTWEQSIAQRDSRYRNSI